MDVMVSNARRLAAALDADLRISKVHFFGCEESAGMLACFWKILDRRACSFFCSFVDGSNGPRMTACHTNMIAFYVDGKKAQDVAVHRACWDSYCSFWWRAYSGLPL